MIRGNVDSLMKLTAALEKAGIELISEGGVSDGGGRGVRLRASRTGLSTLAQEIPQSARALAQLKGRTGMPLVVALWCVGVFLITACLGVGISRMWAASPIIYGLCLLASLTAFGFSLVHLITGAATQPFVTLPLGLPWLGAHFRMDMLAAFFLVVVNLGAAAASMFALGYGLHEKTPHRVLPFYAAFLAGMNLVVLADDAFTFLVSWEFMSLTSWGLVISHHRVSDNVHAGYVYLVMASFGTLTLLLAFGLLAGPDGLYGFAAIRESQPSAGLAAIVLILILIGAGSKAGVVPLHVWLPLAHPAAPSHVSALMSGVMTKVAVYGFVRIVFDLLGPPPGGGASWCSHSVGLPQ